MLIDMIGCFILCYYLFYFIEKHINIIDLLVLMLLSSFSVILIADFYLRYLIIFLINLIYFVLYKRNNKQVSILYCLLLATILFMCDIYTNTMFFKINSNNLIVLNIFMLASKLMFLICCMLIKELMNNKSKLRIIRIVILSCTIVLFACVLDFLSKDIYQVSKEIVLGVFGYTLIIVLLFVYIFLVKKEDSGRYLELEKIKYQSQLNNSVKLNRLYHDVVTKEHHMFYVLKKIESLTNDIKVKEFIENELANTMKLKFVYKTGNDIFDEMITKLINDYKERGYDIKVISYIDKEDELNVADNVYQIERFLTDILSLTNKVATIYITNKNDYIIIKITSIFKENNNNYLYSRDNGLESYNFLIKKP